MRKKKSTKMQRAPNETAEVGLKVAEALISSVPVVGGFLAGLFELLSIPLSQRKQHWLDKLAEVVSELKDRVSELSKPLNENQDFLTAVLVATPAAMRTQREEKLAALRNAVRNSALKSAPREDLQVVFLRLVDELTASHLRILAALDNPEASIAETGKDLRAFGLRQFLFHCVPELKGQDEFCEQLFRDLQARSLIAQGLRLDQVMSPPGLLNPHITNLGRLFLKFIS